MTEIYGVELYYWPLTRFDNRPNRPFPNGKADWITIHETGNVAPTATAMNTGRWVHNGSPRNGLSQQLSFHDAIDDIHIVQLLRDNEQGWHAADGDGNGNTRSWGLEVCVNGTGARRLKAWDNAARRTAWLLDNGHGSQGIVQHNNWSGKNCPEYMRKGQPYAWQEFLARVQSYRNGGGLGMTESEVREIVREELAAWEDEFAREVGAKPQRIIQAIVQRLWAINRATDPARVPGDT
jgi:N-acetylmuramoyl-L-alanine amidase CwlA